MVQIANLPFTQDTNLNILNQLRIKGILVNPGGGQDIVEVLSGNYTQEIDDDIIIMTGPATLQLIKASTGIKLLRIKSKIGGGQITVTPFSGDTINTASTLVIENGVGQAIVPLSADWEIVG